MTSKKDNLQTVETPGPKQEWCRMELKCVGKVNDVVQGGGGKLSLTGADPGEGKKEKGGNH